LTAAGVDPQIAADTADGLWTASIRGVDSHGIRLLPHYLKELEGGRINPEPDFEFEKTAEAVGTFNADHTYGIAAATRAMEHAIELATDAGTGHVSVRNSSHCGSMATFGLMAAEEDMIGYATTHGTANTKSPGSSRPFFGNNPICVAAPMADEGPFCFDAAQKQQSLVQSGYLGRRDIFAINPSVALAFDDDLSIFRDRIELMDLFSTDSPFFLPDETPSEILLKVAIYPVFECSPVDPLHRAILNTLKQ
jgi:hypothetical protein